MSARKLTTIVIGLVIAAIAVYDVYIINTAGTEASISQVMIEWSYRYPVFTFAMGLAMGHLFWRLRDNKRTEGLGNGKRLNSKG